MIHTDEQAECTADAIGILTDAKRLAISDPRVGTVGWNFCHRAGRRLEQEYHAWIVRPEDEAVSVLS